MNQYLIINDAIDYPAYIIIFIYTFLDQKIPNPPKPTSFSIQNILHCAALSLIILTAFLLNLVSCTQQVSIALCSIFSELPLKLTFQIMMWLDDSLIRPIFNTSPAMLGIFTLKDCNSVYAVPSIKTFFQLDVLPDIDPIWWWKPIFLSRNHLEMILQGNQIRWWGPLCYWNSISRWLRTTVEQKFTYHEM